MKFYGEYKDNEYEYSGTNHTRIVSRGFLLDEDLKIALIHIKGTDEFGERDYYETPGGGVNDNESLTDAVKREVLEETGYSSSIISEIGYVIDYYNLIKRKNITYYYLLKKEKYIKKTLEDYEKDIMESVGFYTIDEAIELYTNHMNFKVGRIVKNRELRVLLDIKNIVEEMKLNETKKI